MTSADDIDLDALREEMMEFVSPKQNTASQGRTISVQEIVETAKKDTTGRKRKQLFEKAFLRKFVDKGNPYKDFTENDDVCKVILECQGWNRILMNLDEVTDNEGKKVTDWIVDLWAGEKEEREQIKKKIIDIYKKCNSTSNRGKDQVKLLNEVAQESVVIHT